MQAPSDSLAASSKGFELPRYRENNENGDCSELSTLSSGDEAGSQELSESEDQDSELESTSDGLRTEAASVGLKETNSCYIDLYNTFVEEFFELRYGHAREERSMRRKRRKLDDSIINSEGAFYKPTDKVKNTPDQAPEAEDRSWTELSDKGSLWTGEEKEIFFGCLARYTIHRVDEFLQHLPGKSLGEIIAYYELLKRELKQYRIKELHRVEFPNDISARPKRLRHNYDIVTTTQGVSQVNFPIAYEVNEEWINFEEKQSHVLSRKVNKAERDNRSGRFEAENLKDYTEPRTNDAGTLDSLIKMEVAAYLSKIYRGGPSTELGSISPRLLFTSLIYLEEIVKLVTRRIITNLALIKLPEGEPKNGINVTPADVRASVEAAGLLEGIRIKGQRKRFSYGGLLRSYWTHLESLVEPEDGKAATLRKSKPHDNAALKQLQSVMVPSPTSEDAELPNWLMEEAAYGEVIPDDETESSNSLSEEVEEVDLNASADENIQPPSASRPILGGTNLTIISSRSGFPEFGNVDTNKNATDIAIEDALIQNETLALELNDKQADEALAVAVAAEYGISFGGAAHENALDNGGRGTAVETEEGAENCGKISGSKGGVESNGLKDNKADEKDDNNQTQQDNNQPAHNATEIGETDNESEIDRADEDINGHLYVENSHDTDTNSNEPGLRFTTLLQRAWDRHSTIY